MTDPLIVTQTRTQINASYEALEKLCNVLASQFEQTWDALEIPPRATLLVNRDRRSRLNEDGDYTLVELSRDHIIANTDKIPKGRTTFSYQDNIYDTLHALGVLVNKHYTLITP